MIVIYHADCYDGFTAAWVAKQRYPDAPLVPGVYGQPIPDAAFDAEDDVLMVDITYPLDQMEHLRRVLASRGRALIVLDHHATAQATLDGWAAPNLTVVFDMEKSGARLAWDYCFPLEHPTPPRLVRYVEDRDLWRWALPASREINAFIGTNAFDLAAWTDLSNFLELQFLAAVQLGMAVTRRDDALVDQLIRRTLTWRRIAADEDYVVPVAVAPVLMSEVGHSLLERFPDAPFAAYYFDRADGWQQWGLRSRPGFDVSRVAKVFGGGGHPQAAGFQFSPSERLAGVTRGYCDVFPVTDAPGGGR